MKRIISMHGTGFKILGVNILRPAAWRGRRRALLFSRVQPGTGNFILCSVAVVDQINGACASHQRNFFSPWWDPKRAAENLRDGDGRRRQAVGSLSISYLLSLVMGKGYLVHHISIWIFIFIKKLLITSILSSMFWTKKLSYIYKISKQQRLSVS